MPINNIYKRLYSLLDMKKKVFGILFTSLFLSIFLASLASAYGYLDFRQGSERVIEWVTDFSEPFLQIILGGEDYTGVLLFERFLIFLIILSIVYLSLKNVYIFQDNKGVLWTVSIIVPLLAVRFMDFGWINAILVQYEVLGIALAGILPFIIYLIFLHNISESSIVRKVGWAFFIVVYFGLWSTNKTETYGQIYFWAMLAALVFLLLDETIHKIFESQKFREGERAGIYRRIAEIDKNRETIQKSSLPEHIKNKQILGLLRERKNMEKRL